MEERFLKELKCNLFLSRERESKKPLIWAFL
jgi:hypothetical protein